MNDKDTTDCMLSLPFQFNRRRSAAISAVITVAAVFLGGCDWGESPQGPYQPGIVYDDKGSLNDGGYPYDDGGYEGGGPGRFNPPPA